MFHTALLLSLLGQPSTSPSAVAGEAEQPAEPADGEDLRAVANELYEQGRYEQADAVLAAAYAVDPDPDLLFARAVIAKELGDCERAIELWTLYLESEPDAEGTQHAQTYRADCKGEVEPEPEPEATVEATVPPPPPPPSAAVPNSPPPAPIESRRRWYRDPLGGLLLGAGVLTAATGGGLLGAAFGRVSSSKGAPSESDFHQDVTAGTNLNRAGITLIAVGGAFIVGSAIRYAIVARGR